MSPTAPSAPSPSPLSPFTSRDRPATAPAPLSAAETPAERAVPHAMSMAFEASAAAQMERMLSDLRRMYQERKAALEDLERAHHEALMRLAQMAELRDDDTGVHIVRLGYLAERLGLLLGMEPEQAWRLRLAAPMHDVGKVGVADRVLKKPGPLTADERFAMQEHPRMGADILGRSRHPLFALAAEVALHHHERWDGSGYPAGLAGEAIPMSGRIVAVVDFFDALTMNRCYRRAFDDADALEMLRMQSGLSFDPQVVATFLAHADEMIALREWVNEWRPEVDDLPEVDPPKAAQLLAARQAGSYASLNAGQPVHIRAATPAANAESLT